MQERLGGAAGDLGAIGSDEDKRAKAGPSL